MAEVTQTIKSGDGNQLSEGVLRGDTFVSLEDLEARARRVSAGLRSLGVEANDTIGLLLRNDHEFFEASFAAATVGAAPVPLNWHGSADEVAYVLGDSKSRVLVAHADLLRHVRHAVPSDVTVVGVETPEDIAAAYDIPSAHRLVPDDTIEWSAWRDSFEPLAAATTEIPLSMIYTSGTTGRPKGVRRLPSESQAAQSLEYLVDVSQIIGLTPGMRTVITGPMYHTAPNTYALNAARFCAGFLVLQDRFDPEELLVQIERHKITSLHMVPTMFVRLLRLPSEVRSRYDLSSLVNVVHAAAPCPPDIKRAMIDWLGPIVYEYYGGTETGAVVGCDSNEWLSHSGTVGRPLATCTVRIFGEDGEKLPTGQPGEVFMRAGGFPDFTYEGKAQARTDVEKEGLFTCGDVGYLDEDGFLYLCDRVRDMIISGGVNIYPAEIEACLLNLPGIADCAVFGIPDSEYGEAIAAAVELDPGARLSESDIQLHVREHLAAFKSPKLVEFHDKLPREDSGKMFKRKLREPHWREVGRSI